MNQYMCDVSSRVIESFSDTTFSIWLIALERLCVQGKQSMRLSFNLKITAVSFLLKMSLNYEVVKDRRWQFLMLLITVISSGNKLPINSVLLSSEINGKDWGITVL